MKKLLLISFISIVLSACSRSGEANIEKGEVTPTTSVISTEAESQAHDFKRDGLPEVYDREQPEIYFDTEDFTEYYVSDAYDILKIPALCKSINYPKGATVSSDDAYDIKFTTENAIFVMHIFKSSMDGGTDTIGRYADNELKNASITINDKTYSVSVLDSNFDTLDSFLNDRGFEIASRKVGLSLFDASSLEATYLHAAVAYGDYSPACMVFGYSTEADQDELKQVCCDMLSSLYSYKPSTNAIATEFEERSYYGNTIYVPEGTVLENKGDFTIYTCKDPTSIYFGTQISVYKDDTLEPIELPVSLASDYANALISCIKRGDEDFEYIITNQVLDYIDFGENVYFFEVTDKASYLEEKGAKTLPTTGNILKSLKWCFYDDDGKATMFSIHSTCNWFPNVYYLMGKETVNNFLKGE